MKKILKVHFEANNILTPSQFGFQSHLTLSTALGIVRIILDSIEDDNVPAAALEDLIKAFDCMSHDIRLHKLEHYGVCIVALKLIQFHVRDHIQIVSYGLQNI